MHIFGFVLVLAFFIFNLILTHWYNCRTDSVHHCLNHVLKNPRSDTWYYLLHLVTCTQTHNNIFLAAPKSDISLTAGECKPLIGPSLPFLFCHWLQSLNISIDNKNCFKFYSVHFRSFEWNYCGDVSKYAWQSDLVTEFLGNSAFAEIITVELVLFESMIIWLFSWKTAL